MGGCATKPKDLKLDSGIPAPEESKIDAEETKKVEGGEKKVEEEVAAKEIVAEDDKVEEDGSKRKSLSSLFKESEAKESTQNVDITQKEADVPPTGVKAEKPEESKPGLPEPEKTEKVTSEEQPAAAVVASQPVETEKKTEVETEKSVQVQSPKKEETVANVESPVEGQTVPDVESPIEGQTLAKVEPNVESPKK